MSAAEFDWLTLDGDEEVVWSARPRLVGYVWVFVAGALLIPVVGLGLAVIAWAYLTANNTAYVITSERVYKKTGILSRNVTDIGHAKIQDTGYRQGVVGKRLGFGTVEISTAGGSDVELRFSYVPDPLGVQSTLDDVARTAPGEREPQREDDGVTGERSRALEVDDETVQELVAELRGTREAMESIERRLEEQSGSD